MRPDQPLAQYQLRARREYNVDVFVYFGTSRPSKARWTRHSANSKGSSSARSSRLVLRLPRASKTQPPSPSSIGHTRARRSGGSRAEEPAHSGVRGGSGWAKLPYAGASSGGWAGPLTALPNAPSNTLAWITAGAPRRHDGRSRRRGFPGSRRRDDRREQLDVPAVESEGRARPVGLAAAPRRDLVASTVRLPVFSCDSGIGRGHRALRERARIFLATNAPVREAKLAVRTPAGRLSHTRTSRIQQSSSPPRDARANESGSLVSVLLAAALLAGPPSAATGASASPAGTHVVDRTLVCRRLLRWRAVIFLTAQSAPVRESSSGSRRPRSRRRKTAVEAERGRRSPG